MPRFENGKGCAAGEGWDDHNKKVDDLADDVFKINLGLAQMQTLLKHMEQLPIMVQALMEMKDKTLHVAMGGKDEALMKMFMKVVGVLLGVILALVGVIGVLLVGEKLGLIRGLIP